MTRSLLVLMLLAGCAGPPQTPDEAACTREADSDPAVKLIIIKMAGSEHYQRENQDLLAYAQKAAVVKCLKARGVVPRGGVEAQRPQK